MCVLCVGWGEAGGGGEGEGGGGGRLPGQNTRGRNRTSAAATLAARADSCHPILPPLYSVCFWGGGGGPGKNGRQQQPHLHVLALIVMRWVGGWGGGKRGAEREKECVC